MAIVYLIKADKWWKIGCSAQIDKRMKALATQPPFALELWHVIDVSHENMYAAEGELHRGYSKCRIRGEWFMLEPAMIEELTSLDIYGYDGFESLGLVNHLAYRMGFTAAVQMKLPGINPFAAKTKCGVSWWSGYSDAMLVFLEQGWRTFEATERLLGHSLCVRVLEHSDTHGFAPDVIALATAAVFNSLEPPKQGRKHPDYYAFLHKYAPIVAETSPKYTRPPEVTDATLV